MVTELISKYLWLMQTVIDSGPGGLSLSQISSRYENRFGETLVRRTFINYKSAVEEVFGIEICCDRSTNRYYVDSSNKMSGEDSRQWIIDSFTVGSILEKGKESLSGRIEVESVPSGREHLTKIMGAMLENHIVLIDYRKYSAEKAEHLTVKPYALKEDKRRWYLYGFCVERDALRCYALDRVMSLTDSGKEFKMPANFDIRELLATSFGTYAPQEGEKGSTIEFRAKGLQAKYIEDLPLHHSQKLLRKEGEWSYFSIFVIADNADLYFELRKYGPGIEVLSPQKIRDRLQKEAVEVAEMYGCRD